MPPRVRDWQWSAEVLRQGEVTVEYHITVSDRRRVRKRRNILTDIVTGRTFDIGTPQVVWQFLDSIGHRKDIGRVKALFGLRPYLEEDDQSHRIRLDIMAYVLFVNARVMHDLVLSGTATPFIKQLIETVERDEVRLDRHTECVSPSLFPYATSTTAASPSMPLAGRAIAADIGASYGMLSRLQQQALRQMIERDAQLYLRQHWIQCSAGPLVALPACDLIIDTRRQIVVPTSTSMDDLLGQPQVVLCPRAAFLGGAIGVGKTRVALALCHAARLRDSSDDDNTANNSNNSDNWSSNGMRTRGDPALLPNTATLIIVRTHTLSHWVREAYAVGFTEKDILVITGRAEWQRLGDIRALTRHALVFLTHEFAFNEAYYHALQQVVSTTNTHNAAHQQTSMTTAHMEQEILRRYAHQRDPRYFSLASYFWRRIIVDDAEDEVSCHHYMRLACGSLWLIVSRTPHVIDDSLTPPPTSLLNAFGFDDDAGQEELDLWNQVFPKATVTVYGGANTRPAAVSVQQLHQPVSPCLCIHQIALTTGEHAVIDRCLTHMREHTNAGDNLLELDDLLRALLIPSAYRWWPAQDVHRWWACAEPQSPLAIARSVARHSTTRRSPVASDDGEATQVDEDDNNVRTAVPSSSVLLLDHFHHVLSELCSMEEDRTIDTTTPSTYTCPICFDRQSDVLMRCGHVMCLRCLLSHMMHTEVSPPQCPVCKTPFRPRTMYHLKWDDALVAAAAAAESQQSNTLAAASEAADVEDNHWLWSLTATVALPTPSSKMAAARDLVCSIVDKNPYARIVICSQWKSLLQELNEILTDMLDPPESPQQPSEEQQDDAAVEHQEKHGSGNVSSSSSSSSPHAARTRRRPVIRILADVNPLHRGKLIQQFVDTTHPIPHILLVPLHQQHGDHPLRGLHLGTSVSDVLFLHAPTGAIKEMPHEQFLYQVLSHGGGEDVSRNEEEEDAQAERLNIHYLICDHSIEQKCVSSLIEHQAGLFAQASALK